MSAESISQPSTFPHDAEPHAIASLRTRVRRDAPISTTMMELAFAEATLAAYDAQAAEIASLRAALRAATGHTPAAPAGPATLTDTYRADGMEWRWVGTTLECRWLVWQHGEPGMFGPVTSVPVQHAPGIFGLPSAPPLTALVAQASSIAHEALARERQASQRIADLLALIEWMRQEHNRPTAEAVAWIWNYHGALTTTTSREEADRWRAKGNPVLALTTCTDSGQDHEICQLPWAHPVAVALRTPGLTDIHLTFGHPTYGIECTAVVDDTTDATLTHQPDGATAIVNAVAAAVQARAKGTPPE